MPTFSIRTKLVDTPRARDLSESDTWLGAAGVLCPQEEARRFRTRSAAEKALMEEWNRLRNAGNRSVILSVVTRGRT